MQNHISSNQDSTNRPLSQTDLRPACPGTDSFGSDYSGSDYPGSDYLGSDYLDTASAQDCTGLIPAAPASDGEVENYQELYPFLAKVTDEKEDENPFSTFQMKQNQLY